MKMAVAEADLLSDEAIYQRTPAGQREVVFGDRRLSDLERRFLLMVNGNTPLRTLLELMDARGNVGQSIRRLVDLELLSLQSEHVHQPADRPISAISR